MNKLLKFLLSIPLFILNVFLVGFTYMKVWNWHLAGFLKLPEITGIIQALGIALAIRYFTESLSVAKTEIGKSYIEKLLFSMIAAMLTLGFSYLWYVLR